MYIAPYNLTKRFDMYMTKLMFKSLEVLVAGGTLLSGLAPAVSTMSTFGTLLGAFSSIQSGRAQSKAYKLQAQNEAEAEKDREIQRLRKLRMAQSSQRAYFGSRGVDPYAGSAETIASESRFSYKRESEADRISTGREIQSLGTRASSANTAGFVKGFTEVVSLMPGAKD